MADRTSAVVTGAVWLGSLVLVGIPTLTFLSTARLALLSELGTVLDVWLLVAIGIVEIAVSVYTTSVVARVRLHGYGELRHASTIRTIARHVVLVVPATLAIGFVGYLALAIGAGIEADGGGGTLSITSFTIAVVAFVVLVARAVTGFWTGLKSDSRTMAEAPECK